MESSNNPRGITCTRARPKSVPSELREEIFNSSNQCRPVISISQCSVLWCQDGGRVAGDEVVVASFLG